MKDGPQVLDNYKGKGVGKTLYRIAEGYFKLRIMPDGKPTEDGKRFRESYEKKYGSWKNEFEPTESDSQLPVAEEVEYKKNSFVR